MNGPKAAAAIWPYPHRTVAEIDSAREEAKIAAWWKKRAAGQFSTSRKSARP